MKNASAIIDLFCFSTIGEADLIIQEVFISSGLNTDQ